LAAAGARAGQRESVRQGALRAAAGVWADVVAGTVEEVEVAAAVDGLSSVDLPWEGSRLAGHAAIGATDAGLTRRLLERARELSPAPTGRGTTQDPEAAVPAAALSERELEVSRLVLEGRTHREIGAQLYLSPKTVEHHVARIRTKLGATSRAELLAALRDLLR
jgi:DNA-binding CsgD family transcriptional regulator